MTRTIGFLIFPDFQLLDAAGPISVFEIGGRYAESAYRQDVLASQAGPVASSAGASLTAIALDAAPPLDTLVIAGFTTDCCVDATARAAFHRNYNVFVVSDACDSYDPELHHWALKALRKNAALLVDTASVLAAWPAPALSARA